jgi:hypothetical protein
MNSMGPIAAMSEMIAYLVAILLCQEINFRSLRHGAISECSPIGIASLAPYSLETNNDWFDGDPQGAKPCSDCPLGRRLIAICSAGDPLHVGSPGGRWAVSARARNRDGRYPRITLFLLRRSIGVNAIGFAPCGPTRELARTLLFP